MNLGGESPRPTRVAAGTGAGTGATDGVGTATCCIGLAVAYTGMVLGATDSLGSVAGGGSGLPVWSKSIFACAIDNGLESISSEGCAWMASSAVGTTAGTKSGALMCFWCTRAGALQRRAV